MEKLGGLTPPVPASKISSRKSQMELEPRIDANEHEFRVVIRVYSQPVRPSLLIKSCIATSRRRRIHSWVQNGLTDSIRDFPDRSIIQPSCSISTGCDYIFRFFYPLN